MTRWKLHKRGLADDSKLPSGEGERPLAPNPAMEQAMPGFTLTTTDASILYEMLKGYGPYANGQTAVFWHIVGIIGSHRRKELVDPVTPAGKLLGVEIAPPCSCGCNVEDPFCFHHGINASQSKIGAAP